MIADGTTIHQILKNVDVRNNMSNYGLEQKAQLIPNSQILKATTLKCETI